MLQKTGKYDTNNTFMLHLPSNYSTFLLKYGMLVKSEKLT